MPLEKNIANEGTGFHYLFLNGTRGKQQHPFMSHLFRVSPLERTRLPHHESIPISSRFYADKNIVGSPYHALSRSNHKVNKTRHREDTTISTSYCSRFKKKKKEYLSCSNCRTECWKGGAETSVQTIMHKIHLRKRSRKKYGTGRSVSCLDVR